ncbi:SRPBCC family protein [Streptomyces sp. CB01881]|uniref:SRPBCC family protein n=1 Tax=Streptomyces sp. CB01881 TaxID=2078691 RepID=UPI000CDCC9C5|nr:SRPBCC family protein [Streptomyces sp. CB01881]AUY49329.1 polyketide cyclase [Streptomyces sp. CB01881]TYC72716.1 SRPBCC family protein [Streptomyces sp. CB01881]
MGQVQATTEHVYDATPERVYEALADYQVTRPKLLPAQYSEYEVRVGGTGAGTQVHWKLQATEKRIRDCLFTVSAPTPDQLVEKDANSSMVITWTVSAVGEGRSKVTVSATWQGAGGIGGFFERTFAPKGLNRIHDQVLAALAATVR